MILYKTRLRTHHVIFGKTQTIKSRRIFRFASKRMLKKKSQRQLYIFRRQYFSAVFNFFPGLFSTGKTRRKFRVFLVAGSRKRFIQIKTNCLGTDFVDTLRTSGEFKLILNKRWWRIVRGVDFFLFGLRSFDGDVLWQPEELAPGWGIFTNVIKNKVTMMSYRSFPFCAIIRKQITRRFRIKFIWTFDCVFVPRKK